MPMMPEEMDAFIKEAELAGVKTVIESGRGYQAYSTIRLAKEVKRLGWTVISVDWEKRWWNALRSRWKVWGLPVQVIRGDAFRKLPELVWNAEGPIAVLVDGPKGPAAVSLLLSLASWHEVKVVALHNADEPETWKAFASAFHGASLAGQLGIARVNR